MGNFVERAVVGMDGEDSVNVDEWSFQPEDESVGRRRSNALFKCSKSREKGI